MSLIKKAFYRNAGINEADYKIQFKNEFTALLTELGISYTFVEFPTWTDMGIDKTYADFNIPIIYKNCYATTNQCFMVQGSWGINRAYPCTKWVVYFTVDDIKYIVSVGSDNTSGAGPNREGTRHIIFGQVTNDVSVDNSAKAVMIGQMGGSHIFGTPDRTMYINAIKDLNKFIFVVTSTNYADNDSNRIVLGHIKTNANNYYMLPFGNVNKYPVLVDNMVKKINIATNRNSFSKFYSVDKGDILQGKFPIYDYHIGLEKFGYIGKLNDTVSIDIQMLRGDIVNINGLIYMCINIPYEFSTTLISERSFVKC